MPRLFRLRRTLWIVTQALGATRSLRRNCCPFATRLRSDGRASRQSHPCLRRAAAHPPSTASPVRQAPRLRPPPLRLPESNRQVSSQKRKPVRNIFRKSTWSYVLLVFVSKIVLAGGEPICVDRARKMQHTMLCWRGLVRYDRPGVRVDALAQLLAGLRWRKAG